jgi:hypothetical protein
MEHLSVEMQQLNDEVVLPFGARIPASQHLPDSGLVGAQGNRPEFLSGGNTSPPEDRQVEELEPPVVKPIDSYDRLVCGRRTLAEVEPNLLEVFLIGFVEKCLAVLAQEPFLNPFCSLLSRVGSFFTRTALCLSS